MYRSDWLRGTNAGAVIKNGLFGGYIAVTAVLSRDFKTINGAERFMKKNGYRMI